MKRLVASLSLAVVGLAAVPAQAPAVAAEPGSPNVILIVADDQRWDKVTSEYMPNVWNLGHASAAASLGGHEDADGIAFRNSFVPNPLCCPSRVTMLSGQNSHTNHVWNNNGPYGGFAHFDDSSSIATDFKAAGYRTGMVGKYLNGYIAGHTRYVPPGWDKWFGANTSSFYDYGITTNNGTRRYGSDPQDYITRVLNEQVQTFVANPSPQPFFLMYSFTAPHGPAIPDPRDVGRFRGEADYSFGSNKTGKYKSSQLESAYSMDRAIGQLLRNVPDNTVVVYIGDNGYLWGENRLVPEGNGLGTLSLHGKQWPYEESLRVPIVYASLDGTRMPVAARDDLVLNLDLRDSLTRVAGLAPLGYTEGINWFDPGYVARQDFVTEHILDPQGKVHVIPTYCGARSVDYMFARFSGGQEVFYKSTDGEQPTKLLHEADAPAEYAALKLVAQQCQPPVDNPWLVP